MPTRSQQVSRVLYITLVLNLAVAAGKIVIGLVTGALAITADGLHSMIDSSGNVVGLIAVRIAASPPDADHPYGHSRYETLAALGIGAFLLLTAFEIVQGALERLQSGTIPDLTPLAFVVMLATLVINVFVSRYQIREGKRLELQILLADAANTSSDVIVTLSVLASMVLTVVFGWAWADVAAALLVTLLIARAALRILRQTGRVLVDTAPFDPDALSAAILEIPAVNQVLRVRSRGTDHDAYVDVEVLVAPEMTADETSALGQAIRAHLQAQWHGIREVEVQFVPAQDHTPDYAQYARARALPLELTTHEVVVSDSPDGKVLEMHVEVPPDQTLETAHERVSQLEQAVKQTLPDVVEVVTHIEPAQKVVPEMAADASEAGRLERQVRALLKKRYPTVQWHHLYVHPLEDGYAVGMHLTLPPQMRVEAAHRVAEQIEMQLRLALPKIERVTIHTEPPD